LSQVKAEYYVILNSDVEVTANWINPLIKHMEKDSKMAAAMPKIKSYNDKEYFEHAGASGGFIDKYGYTFCRGRIFNRVEKDQGQYDDATEVFWATGACMFIKAELFHKIGGFDHNYFAHMEEIDLCWRLKNNGFKIYCFPEVEVFHKGGGALPYNNPFKVYLNFRNNLITLYKNLPEKKYRRIILMRFLLDMLAVIMFLLTFRFKHCFAVCRAYISLIKMFSYYKNIRKELVNINSFVEPVYKRSIVFKYWIENKKSYSKLKF